MKVVILMNDAVAIEMNDNSLVEEKLFCVRCGAKLTNKRCCLHCGAMINDNEINDFLEGKKDEVTDQEIQNVKNKFTITMVFYLIMLSITGSGALLAFISLPFLLIVLSFGSFGGGGTEFTFGLIFYIYFFLIFLSAALLFGNSFDYSKYINKTVGCITTIVTGLTMLLSIVIFFILLLI